MLRVSSAFLFLLLISLTACITNKKISSLDLSETLPPGGVRISKNFFADENEITNLSYLEFLYWSGMVWGKDSVKKLLPDTMVWRDLNCGRKKMLNYLRHPRYRDYPVVGVSFDQARAFSKWRSDRVMEFMLIKYGYLEHTPKPDQANYFSIEKYYAGKIPLKKERIPFPWYPEFRLPSPAEWKKIQVASDSVFTQKNNQINKNNAVERTKLSDAQINCVFLNTLSPICIGDSMVKEPIRKQSYQKEKVQGLVKNIRGNLSEMSNTKGVSLGGSWKHPALSILKQDTFHYQKPDLYTGFRNVCEWRKAPTAAQKNR